MWKVGSIQPEFSFIGKWLIGICTRTQGNLCYFINVHSSCIISRKRALWSSLVYFKSKLEVAEWIVGGKFNCVKCSSERQGRIAGRNVVDMIEFNEFIENMELVEVLMIGNPFTWLNIGGSCRVNKG